MRRAKNTKIAAARRNRNMRLFAIDADHAITAFPAVENVPEGQEHFASEKDLAKLAANSTMVNLMGYKAPAMWDESIIEVE
jgi:hypothetical protein